MLYFRGAAVGILYGSFLVIFIWTLNGGTWIVKVVHQIPIQRLRKIKNKNKDSL